MIFVTGILHFATESHVDCSALIIEPDFVGDPPSAPKSADNIFYGHRLDQNLPIMCPLSSFWRGGIRARPQRILQSRKAARPQSNYAVTGFYCHDRLAAGIFESLLGTPQFTATIE